MVFITLDISSERIYTTSMENKLKLVSKIPSLVAARCPRKSQRVNWLVDNTGIHRVTAGHMMAGNIHFWPVVLEQLAQALGVTSLADLMDFVSAAEPAPADPTPTIFENITAEPVLEGTLDPSPAVSLE